MNIMTVVKYKLKSGFEDEFIKAINAYNYSNSILMRLVSIGNEEYLSIMEYDEIDKTGDDEISGVDWLDSIEHMLEFFDDSRTDACSGLVLSSYNQIKIFNPNEKTTNFKQILNCNQTLDITRMLVIVSNNSQRLFYSNYFFKFA